MTNKETSIAYRKEPIAIEDCRPPQFGEENLYRKLDELLLDYGFSLSSVSAESAYRMFEYPGSHGGIFYGKQGILDTTLTLKAVSISGVALPTEAEKAKHAQAIREELDKCEQCEYDHCKNTSHLLLEEMHLFLVGERYMPPSDRKIAKELEEGGK